VVNFELSCWRVDGRCGKRGGRINPNCKISHSLLFTYTVYVCVWCWYSVRAAGVAEIRQSFPATVQLTHNDDDSHDDYVTMSSAVRDRATFTFSLYHPRPSTTSAPRYIGIPVVTGQLSHAGITWISSTRPD